MPEVDPGGGHRHVERQRGHPAQQHRVDPPPQRQDQADDRPHQPDGREVVEEQPPPQPPIEGIAGQQRGVAELRVAPGQNPEGVPVRDRQVVGVQTHRNGGSSTAAPVSHIRPDRQQRAPYLRVKR